MSDIHEIKLSGCTPEPLMGYLKGLGVLRLVAEQKDRNAKGCWRNGEFVLESSLGIQALLDFFTNEYKPTPVIVPWSGGDYFGVNVKGNSGPYKSTPTAADVIEAFLASTSARLSEYRDAIVCALDVLQLCGIKTKDQMKDKAKSRFISSLRSKCGEAVVRWIDTCAVMSAEKASFSALLGGGGGSDGNTHFSDNFMQNLWEVLPDFDDQRKARKQIGHECLKNALFGTPFPGLVPKRTSSLYDGGAVGGPNAGQGFERISFGNPWSFVLCIEGAVLLAGCISKRAGISSSGSLSFPFQTRLSSTSSDSSSDNEASGREMWMPLWEVFAGIHEIKALFSEGRSSVGRRHSSRGVDFARAATSLGIDRGIVAFQRFGIVKGRIGRDNNTAVSFGRFDVRLRADVDLLKEADAWLDRFRGAASGDKIPQRFPSAVKRIESAVFDFCKYGGTARFQEILCALGTAEHEIVITRGKIGQNGKINPLSGLSTEWLPAANDYSPEFALALSLAGIYDIRANMEPVSHGRWKEKDFCDVWNNAGLCANLLSVLERRMMDAGRLGCKGLPLMSRYKAPIDAISKFIAGDVNDRKIEELLWGMILMDHWKPIEKATSSHFEKGSRSEGSDHIYIPRPYAILKLVFIPGGLGTNNVEILVRPEPAIPALLRAGRTGEACAIAARRLRISGMTPMTYRKGKKSFSEVDWLAEGIDPVRLGAALLFPVSSHGLNELKQMVLRPDTNHDAA